jgi:predicted nucleic acid-binding protein
MNDKVFIDTNLWLYLYSTDEPKKKAHAGAVIASTNNIIISTQVLNELVNVLYKKVKMKPEVIKAVIHEIVSVVSIHTVDLHTIQLAINTAERY